MFHDDKPPLNDSLLAHYGVKGMKWGVCKQPALLGTKSVTPDKSLQKISPTGAITLKKGATLQRVVSGPGVSLGKDFSYASFSERDNLSYELMLGRKKGLLNKKASEILTLTATTDLKAPSPADSSSIYFKTLKENSKARAEIEAGLKEKSLLFSKKDVAVAIANPTSQRAQDFYAHLHNKGNYQTTPSLANQAFMKNVSKAGYNMLFDTMDASTGQGDMPVILLNPGKTVEVSGKRVVDRASVRSAKKALGDLEKISEGKTFLEKLKNDEL